MRTRYGSWTIHRGEGFTIVRPVQRGSEALLSPSQVRNIVFNETRSLSGDGIHRARRNIAHAVMNGDEQLGRRRPITASTAATVPAAERQQYEDSGRMVLRAMGERSLGHDPTGAAVHFNMRRNPSTADFQGARMTTQVGPLQNSFPTTTLPSTGIYVNTYTREEEQ